MPENEGEWVDPVIEIKKKQFTGTINIDLYSIIDKISDYTKSYRTKKWIEHKFGYMGPSHYQFDIPELSKYEYELTCVFGGVNRGEYYLNGVHLNPFATSGHSDGHLTSFKTNKSVLKLKEKGNHVEITYISGTNPEVSVTLGYWLLE